MHHIVCPPLSPPYFPLLTIHPLVHRLYSIRHSFTWQAQGRPSKIQYYLVIFYFL